MSQIAPGEDERACQIAGCEKPAVYQLIKLPEGASEQEKFFCREHGMEYANRGHLAILENM